MAVDRSPVPVRNLYLPTDRFSNLRNTYLPRGQCSPSRNVSKNRPCRKTEWTFSMIDSRARDRIDRLSAGQSPSPAIVLDLDGRQRRSAAASAWQSCRERKLRVKKRARWPDTRTICMLTYVPREYLWDVGTGANGIRPRGVGSARNDEKIVLQQATETNHPIPWRA